MTESSKTQPNKIKHIVLSGGGGTGFAYYGALRESNKDGFWDINNIQTMHGISCGSIFIFILSLLRHISWEDYDDYCIKRPWETVFGFSPDKILKAYNNVGICGKETIELVIAPVLSAVDLPLNITMLTFYEFTGIEIHFYSTNLEMYKLVDISHKTHPDWTLVDAIYSSCALPLLFRPNRVNGEIYVDGGFICNFPLEQCIEQVENPDEIFGINKHGIVKESGKLTGDEPKKEYDNIIDYLLDIISHISKNLTVKPVNSKYTMVISDTITSAWEVYEVVKTHESRAAKIHYGVDMWNEYKTHIGFFANRIDENDKKNGKTIHDI